VPGRDCCHEDRDGSPRGHGRFASIGPFEVKGSVDMKWVLLVAAVVAVLCFVRTRRKRK
jgi:hypothetical protein